MINPAAVTLLVGIFNFCEVVFYFMAALPASVGMGYRLFLPKAPAKVYANFKYKVQRGKIFTVHPFYCGDKLCICAAASAFYPSFM